METDEKYALFRVKGTRYAIPVSQVREIINLPKEITIEPNALKNVMGLINLRGSTVPIYDTRGMMKHDSLVKERDDLISALQQREQEHRNWVEELEKTCVKRREFTLQRNPHLCAFGKWYDQYITSEHIGYEVKNHLQKFDEPHKEIHGLADHIDALIRDGRHQEAIDKVSHAKDTTLSLMINLFSDFYSIIKEAREKDIAIVLNHGTTLAALPVDCIDSIDYLSDISIMDDLSATKLVTSYGKNDNALVLILNTAAIFD